MSVSTPVIEYTDTQQVVKLLNLQQLTSDPNKYMIWQIPTSTDVINQFVRYANEQTTQLWGDLTTSSTIGLARQYASWRAVLNLIETMTVNWVISGLPITVGDISISRLEAMRSASTEIKERALNELWRLYILLSDMQFPSNYISPSPYVDTGGQSFFS